MAEISVTFNGDADDLQDFCDAMGYKSTIPNPVEQPEEGEEGYDTWEPTIPNPETKVQFFQRRTKQYVWNTVYGYRKREVARQAKDDVQYNEF